MNESLLALLGWGGLLRAHLLPFQLRTIDRDPERRTVWLILHEDMRRAVRIRAVSAAIGEAFRHQRQTLAEGIRRFGDDGRSSNQRPTSRDGLTEVRELQGVGKLAGCWRHPKSRRR